MAEKSTLYVDIASLLDIRQSLLSYHMPAEACVALVNSEAYWLRSTDDFEALSSVEIEQLMHAQDARCLGRATLTYMHMVLRQKLLQAQQHDAITGEGAQSTLLVNTYPFELPREALKTIQNFLFHKLQLPCKIQMVCVAPKDLSVNFLKSCRCTHAYIYRVSEWMELHLQDVQQRQEKELRLHFPALGAQPLSDKEHKELKKAGFEDPFSYLEFILSSRICVRFLPAVFYSNYLSAVAILSRADETLRQSATLPPQES